MGFTDHARNREVLNTTNGDLSAAIEILCRLPSGSAPSASSSIVSNISSDDKLTQLWNMGFQDEAKNRDALRRTSVPVVRNPILRLILKQNNSECKLNYQFHNHPANHL
ncbi:hypothetical protein RhiirC2_90067 [Rhizophagus irregularis]|uniref:UBA domain-containing protein n=1 Tax=Rhizophagus irregularis TaxID=588596 RepID=A0A2N1MT49_9GLOM|nr:hypothetical protein RhiirC2_90067 [Rhizophagus irregularis]